MKALAEAVRVSRNLLVVGFLNRFSLLSAFRRARAKIRKSVYGSARFLTFREVKRMAMEAGRMASERVTFDGGRTTLNLCVDRVISEKLERLLGFRLPFGGFAVAKFRVEGKDGTAQGDNR